MLARIVRLAKWYAIVNLVLFVPSFVFWMWVLWPTN